MTVHPKIENPIGDNESESTIKRTEKSTKYEDFNYKIRAIIGELQGFIAFHAPIGRPVRPKTDQTSKFNCLNTNTNIS